MDPVYRRILESEKSMLIENVEWTDIFKRGLVEEQLLTEAEITKMEDFKISERVGKTLKIIAANKSAGAFNRLCRLLERAVHRDVSDVLHHDRDNISWDFQRQGSFQSAAEFTEQVVLDLLEPCSETDDPYIQVVRVAEACKRLRALAVHLQGSQAEEQRFRRRLQRLVSEDAASTSSAERGGGPLLDANNPEDFLGFKALQDRDNQLRRGLLQLAEENASTLQDQVCLLQKELESVRLEKQSRSSEAVGLKASHQTQREQMARMEELIKKQDRELAVFTFSQKKSKRDYVPMKKTDVERILGELKPYMTRYYLKKQSDDNSKDDHNHLTVMMQEQIGLLLQQVDRFKRRVQETSDELLKLEREREQLFTILRRSQSETAHQALPELVRDRLEQERDQQELLRAAIEELRNQVATARTAKLELGKQLETACQQQSPQTSRRANGEVMSSARRRKISLPARPNTAKAKHNAHAHVHDDEEFRRRAGSASHVWK